jgi:hypothetical protein
VSISKSLLKIFFTTLNPKPQLSCAKHSANSPTNDLRSCTKPRNSPAVEKTLTLEARHRAFSNPPPRTPSPASRTALETSSFAHKVRTKRSAGNPRRLMAQSSNVAKKPPQRSYFKPHQKKKNQEELSSGHKSATVRGNNNNHVHIGCDQKCVHNASSNEVHPALHLNPQTLEFIVYRSEQSHQMMRTGSLICE